MSTTDKAVKKKPRGTAAGRKLLAAMNEFGDPKVLAEAIVTGHVPPGAPFTVVRPILPITVMPPGDVAALRKELGLSQARFAAFLNVSVQTVQAWEQGRNPVNGIAYRFLTEVRGDVPYWKAKIGG